MSIFSLREARTDPESCSNDEELPAVAASTDGPFDRNVRNPWMDNSSVGPRPSTEVLLRLRLPVGALLYDARLDESRQLLTCARRPLLRSSDPAFFLDHDVQGVWQQCSRECVVPP